MVDPEELRAFAETARRFARREVEPAVSAEGRDGDLHRVAHLIDRAESTGLVSTGAAESPGHEFGVWGKASLTDGPAPTLAVLEEIGSACAGVAVCVHLAGLACLEQIDAEKPLARAGVALFNGSFRPTRETLQSPPEGAARIETGKGRSVLTGSASFVWAPPGSEGFVVYARDERNGWARLLVPRTTKGVIIEDVGHRTGLAACEVVHLDFHSVELSGCDRLSSAPPFDFLRRLLLGLGAAAVGNARGALRTAAAYAHERYQGGDLIEAHPAVRLLLGESAARIEGASAHLAQAAGVRGDERTGAWRAAAARLCITSDCAAAASDCLQVLGGYGYMEEFRLEKRLRDAVTLKTMIVRPDDLRLLCCVEPSWSEPFTG